MFTASLEAERNTGRDQDDHTAHVAAPPVQQHRLGDVVATYGRRRE